ncbi:MAG: hypothetical protein ACLR78_04200 [Roseburia sp.]
MAESVLSITDSRPTGRTSRSARDARKTPSQRSPDQRNLRSLNALLLRLPGRYHLRRRRSLLRHHLKKASPSEALLVAGIILGVIAVLLGIGEFFYVLTITNLMKDPANAAAFNEFFEQFQQQLGIN